MAKRIGLFFAALAGAMFLMQATVGGVGAQGSVTVRKAATQPRDSLHIVPSVNENIIVLEYLMQMGQISAELEKIQRIFEREMPGNQSITITRNMSATLQGLQQNAQDRLFQIKVMCSAPVARSAWLGIGVSEWKYANLSDVRTPLPYPLVSDVEPRSPAATAGLEPGDEIRQVDGVDVRGRQLAEFIKVPGKKLNLTIQRDGAVQTVHAVLDSGRARVPEACEAATSSPTVRILIQRDSTLAHKAKINPMDTRDTFWFNSAPKGPINATRAAGAKPGVRVLHVTINSHADRGGLRREDMVKSVNKKPVTNLEDFKVAIQAHEKLNRTKFDLEVIRDEKVVALEIPR
jgi:hypothetical protein